MTARSTLEWVATGVAGFGLLMAVISLALPWEVHESSGEYGYTLYSGATGSGGLSYTLGLLVLFGALIGLQFAPRRFNLPLRVSAGVLSLLLLGLLSGVVVSSSLDQTARDSVDEVSWGLILAFVAVLVLGVAAGLSQPAPEGATVPGVTPGPPPEGHTGAFPQQQPEPYPYQGMPPGHG
ncbi:MAG: hypothetical protein ACRDT6_12590 [Micromonosporaceae bacterium]